MPRKCETAMTAERRYPCTYGCQQTASVATWLVARRCQLCRTARLWRYQKAGGRGGNPAKLGGVEESGGVGSPTQRVRPRPGLQF